jgi:hypothetical protein
MASLPWEGEKNVVLMARVSACRVGFSRRPVFAQSVVHRLKPMRQAEARATQGSGKC